MKINKDYLIKVRDYMPTVLPRPRLKRTIYVTGWNEWLPIVKVDVWVQIQKHEDVSAVTPGHLTSFST